MLTQKLPVGPGLELGQQTDLGDAPGAQGARPVSPAPGPQWPSERAADDDGQRDRDEPAPPRGPGRNPHQSAISPRQAGIQPAASPISAPARAGRRCQNTAATISAAGMSWPLSTSAMRV